MQMETLDLRNRQILKITGYILVLTVVFSVSLVFVLNFVSKVSEDDCEYFTLNTLSGRICGKLNRTLFEQRLFYSFRGIPFAKPPVDALRFKAPQPADPWNDTLNAFEFRNHCFRYVSDDIFYGYEDCLYLNVYVPTNSTTIDTNAKLPVMFYIHGGGFSSGASNFYGPDFLMEEDIIVVTSNFRQGPFGHLSLNLPEYSGNMGFKDQALALKWAYDNIGYFGGDKNQITLCGHSSGAITVNLHLISPMSNHSFQRAIMLSGSALYSGLIQQNGEISTLYDLANELNQSISNENELIEFMKNIDAQFLLKNTDLPLLDRRVAGRMVLYHSWNLIIEDENAINPFLTKDPFDILTNPNYESNIDTLFGSGVVEYRLTDEQIDPELLKILDDVFEFQLPLYNTVMDFKTETYKEISWRIRDFFFNGKSITLENLDQANLLMSDIIFLYAIDLNARIQAKRSNARTLFSKFTAYNDWNRSARNSKDTNYTVIFGDHADQVYYLFWYSNKIPDDLYLSLKSDSLPRAIIKSTANFYANFVKYGNGMPNIEPVPFIAPNLTEFMYYDISNDGIFIRVDERRDRMDFWNNLLNEFKDLLNITFDFHDLE